MTYKEVPLLVAINYKHDNYNNSSIIIRKDDRYFDYIYIQYDDDDGEEIKIKYKRNQLATQFDSPKYIWNRMIKERITSKKKRIILVTLFEKGLRKS